MSPEESNSSDPLEDVTVEFQLEREPGGDDDTDTDEAAGEGSDEQPSMSSSPPDGVHTATIQGVYRLSKHDHEQLHVVLEVAQTDWVLPLVAPDSLSVESPPPAIFDPVQETQYKDLRVFVTDILVQLAPQERAFRALDGRTIDVVFGDDGETLQIDHHERDHQFPVRPETAVQTRDRGERVGEDVDEFVDLLTRYFTGANRGLETQFELVAVDDDQEAVEVVGLLTDSYPATWVFDYSEMDDKMSDSMFRLFEAAGGGPADLEEHHVHVIHASESSLGLDDAQIIGTDTQREWAVLLSRDYDEWCTDWEKKHNPSLYTRLSYAVEENHTLLYEFSVAAFAAYTGVLLLLFNYLISPNTVEALTSVLFVLWALLLIWMIISYILYSNTKEHVDNTDSEHEETGVADVARQLWESRRE